MNVVDGAWADFLYVLTLVIWSSAGVLLALSVREVQAYRRETNGWPMLPGAVGAPRLLALVAPARRAIAWQMPNATEPLEREVAAQVEDVKPTPPPQPAPARRAPDHHIAYWTINAHDLSQGSLKVFDSFVDRLDGPAKRRIVLADFEGTRSDETLHAALKGDVALNLIVCREMSPGIDLIPHARLRPPYQRFEVIDFVRDIEAAYDEILILDQASKREQWADFFALGHRKFGDPVVHVPQLNVAAEKTI